MALCCTTVRGEQYHISSRAATGAAKIGDAILADTDAYGNPTLKPVTCMSKSLTPSLPATRTHESSKEKSGPSDEGSIRFYFDIVQQSLVDTPFGASSLQPPAPHGEE